ncbi:cysteine peptidase family C39 domain-containing protein [Dyadobacter sp. 50-39]|nr:cysteine peptidase family C39 domain-containing protein [Dyadobacter sp. 50-39]
MKSFPFFKQLDQMDCGPTCLRMIAQHYGKHHTSFLMCFRHFDVCLILQ